jgi:hypothetical protein
MRDMLLTVNNEHIKYILSRLRKSKLDWQGDPLNYDQTNILIRKGWSNQTALRIKDTLDYLQLDPNIKSIIDKMDINDPMSIFDHFEEAAE